MPGSSSLKHSSYSRPPGAVTWVSPEMYRMRSSSDKTWNRPLSITVANRWSQSPSVKASFTWNSTARKANDDCLAELRWLYDRHDLEHARQDLAVWLNKWQSKHPKLCNWVEANIEAITHENVHHTPCRKVGRSRSDVFDRTRLRKSDRKGLCRRPEISFRPRVSSRAASQAHERDRPTSRLEARSRPSFRIT